MTEHRLKRLTPGMALNAARRVATRLADEGLIEADEIDARTQHIAKRGRTNMDGYDLAKHLDLYCSWDCDFQMAEVLDSFSGEARDELAAAEKAWAERNEITAQFAIGTRVQLDTGETGEVTGIYAHGAAKFCIAIDGDATSGLRIINFEDAHAL